MPTPGRQCTPSARGYTDRVSAALQGTLTRYANVVRQATFKHHLGESDFDEVLQDVRIRLWRALSTPERILAIPPSYVYQTAASAALDLIRRRKPRPSSDLVILEETRASRSADPEDRLALAELREELTRALAFLVKSRRRVVRLHLGGYHRSEIAARLGWSEDKTRNLLYRGLADLRSRLGRSLT